MIYLRTTHHHDDHDLPEDALEHGEGPPELGAAHLHREDAGAHDAVADPDQDPEIRQDISCPSDTFSTVMERF